MWWKRRAPVRTHAVSRILTLLLRVGYMMVVMGLLGIIISLWWFNGPIRIPAPILLAVTIVPCTGLAIMVSSICVYECVYISPNESILALYGATYMYDDALEF